MTFEKYNIVKLSEDNISEAKQLCDICIGEGMYTKAYLQHIITKPEHIFYLLKDHNITIGFFYFFYCSIKDAANLLKISEKTIYNITNDNAEQVGIFKSIGILSSYRSQGLAGELIRYFEQELFNNHLIKCIFVPTWKYDNNVAAQNPLEQKGYLYLCDAFNVWYDVKTLHCPACKQPRCVCAASIFYKKRGL